MAFPQEGRLRELAESIRGRCAHAHQLKMAGQQQSTTAANIQVSLAEDMQKRLREVVQRLQESIRDSTLAGVQQRLQVVAQKLGLKFDTQSSGGSASFFLSCDAFFTEVVCKEGGSISVVKLIQANNQEENEVFLQLLRERKFSDFEQHLKALTQLYSQTSSPADRANMSRALSATESILQSISDSSPQNRVSAVIMDNPLGFVSPRKGGLAMKLTFFVLPIDVVKHPGLDQVRGAVPDGLGVSAQLLVEKSSQINHLCVDPNLFNRTMANFYPQTSQNSVPLPLTIVLSLNSSIPVCGSIAEQLQKIVYGTEQPQTSSQHINEWISNSKFQEKEHFHGNPISIVTLPGQTHHYNLPSDMTSSEPVLPAHRGVLLQKVPFLHPVHIFNIVPLLRKQLVYNTLLASLLRQPLPSLDTRPSDDGSEYVFDVSTSPPDHITITMDLYASASPDKITIEFAIPNQNPTKPVVTVTPGKGLPPAMQPRLSEATTACLSIPVAMRVAMNEPLLLGESARTLIQAHQKNMAALDRQVAVTF